MSRTAPSRQCISCFSGRPSYNKSKAPQCARRSFSKSARASHSESDAFQGAALLRSRRLIELRGPQASQFLQGLTTANIPSETPAQSRAIYSAFLNAQGRLLQDVFIYHLSSESRLISTGSEKWSSDDEQRFLIEVDANQISNLTRWLKKYKLRTKVAIREVSAAEIGVFSAWGDPASSYSSNTHESLSVADTRAPEFGLRLLSREDNLPATLRENLSSMRTENLAEQQYQIRRYIFGIPEGQTELPHETALVHDSNIDYMGGVDFRKGCYVGQELVIRTQHTGVVRKRILPCILYRAEEDIPKEIKYHETSVKLASPGADIKNPTEEGKRARSKGKWLAGVGNIGLALCRLEDMVGLGPAGDILEGWDSKRWIVEQPNNLESKDIMVKAFIPSWWQERISKVKQGDSNAGI